jgi:hypothetical protein
MVTNSSRYSVLSLVLLFRGIINMESHQLKERTVSANEEVRSHDRDATDLARPGKKSVLKVDNLLLFDWSESDLVLANIWHTIHTRVQLHNSCNMGKAYSSMNPDFSMTQHATNKLSSIVLCSCLYQSQ